MWPTFINKKSKTRFGLKQKHTSNREISSGEIQIQASSFVHKLKYNNTQKFHIFTTVNNQNN